MTPPPRDYWRVWSNEAEGYEITELSEPIEHSSLEDAQQAANRSNETARLLRRGYTDWRPVHCREVVIDG